MNINNNNISYFVCGDASESYPQMILDGDRNIGATSSQNIPATMTNSPFIMLQAPDISTYRPSATWWAWTAVDLHLRVGNLGMADGSAQQTTVAGSANGLGHRHQRRADTESHTIIFRSNLPPGLKPARRPSGRLVLFIGGKKNQAGSALPGFCRCRAKKCCSHSRHSASRTPPVISQR